MELLKPAATSDQASGNSALALRVLGPMEVTMHSRPVVIKTGRLRALLAVLAMEAGRVVPIARLTLGVWGEENPPVNAQASLRTYVTRLRSALGNVSIEAHPSGYTLRIPPDRVDALRFRQLLNEAADRPGRERELLAEAIGLWRDEPFVDVHSRWLHDIEAPQLVERYLSAVERLVDLDADGYSDLVAELGALTARFPLRESLWVRLLTQLQRRGRPAEALARYESVRVCLATELGVDPGPHLQRVYADLLADCGPQPSVAA